MKLFRLLSASLSRFFYYTAKSRRKTPAQTTTDTLLIELNPCGTLQEQIKGKDILSARSLKIKGALNGDDFLFLRELKNLRHLDLADALIKKGGAAYYAANTIENDGEIAPYLFYELPLTQLILPRSASTLCSRAFKIPITHIEIPQSVVLIEPDCFSECEELKEIRIADHPDELKLSRGQTGRYGYWGRNIEYLYIGRDLKWDTYYTDDATPFSELSLLKELDIQGYVAYLADYSFYDCRNLLKITLGASLRSLGKGVFEHCTMLCEITVSSPNPPEIKRNTFHPETFQDALLQVPEGCSGQYINHPLWGKFRHITEVAAQA